MKKKIIFNLVPIIFVGTFLIYPLFLLFSKFPVWNISQVLSKNAAIIRFTAFQALLSAFLTMLLGIPGAYLFARTKLPKVAKSFLKSASMVPFVLPGISMAIGFLLTFGNNGIVNWILSFFNLKIRILYTFTAVLIGHVFYNFPLFIRIVGDAFERIDRNFLEMANIEGASRFKRFWYIELPLIAPAVGAAFSLSYLYCFTSFAVVLILGGIKYSTIEVSIYMYLKVLLDFESALALTLFQMIFVTSVSFVFLILSSKSQQSFGEALKEEKPRWSYFYIAVVGLFVFLPLSMASLGGFLKYGGIFTLENFRNLFSQSAEWIIGANAWSVIIYSVLLSSIVGGCVCILGLVSSYASIRYRSFLSILTYLPVAISPATMAFGMILFEAPQAIKLGGIYILISLPLVHSSLQNVWRSFPKEIEEASKIDGCGSVKRFFKIILPVFKKELLGTFAFCMAIALGEITATIILSEGQLTTLSVATYKLFSTRHIGEAQALNSILMWIVLILFFISEQTE